MSDSPDFIISRTFSAPIDLVWQAWTDAEYLKQWWGPVGFSLIVKRFDLRPGGMFLYLMVPEAAAAMWGKFVYGDIVPNTKLSFVSSFSDEHAGTTRHPLSDTWPLKTFTTLTLEQTDGGTIVSLVAHPVHATDIERATFDGAHDGMAKGFAGTFDQLAGFLAKQQ